MHNETLAPNKIGQGNPTPNVGVFWLSFACYLLLECTSTGMHISVCESRYQACGHQYFENQLYLWVLDSVLERLFGQHRSVFENSVLQLANINYVLCLFKAVMLFVFLVVCLFIMLYLCFCKVV